MERGRGEKECGQELSWSEHKYDAIRVCTF